MRPRALLLTLLVTAGASASASAGPPEIIASFPSPGDSASGLGWDGQTLWVANLQTAVGGGENRVTQHDPRTMAELGGFDMPATDIFHGLAFDADGLIWTDNFNKSNILLTDIVRVDRAGTTLQVFPAHGTLYGVAYDLDARRLFQVDNHSVEPGGNALPSDLYVVDPDDGGLLSGPIPLSFPGARGIAWDGEALWIASNATDSLYRVDVDTGATLAQLVAPGAGGTEGLAYDGRCLWVSDTQSDTLFVVSPQEPSLPVCDALPPVPDLPEAGCGGGAGEGVGPDGAAAGDPGADADEEPPSAPSGAGGVHTPRATDSGCATRPPPLADTRAPWFQAWLPLLAVLAWRRRRRA
jgi:DNA-binding beta-propeller fold protein YncE